MDARKRWALGLGTLDTALFVALLAAIRFPELDRAGAWAFLAFLWAMCIVGSWMALHYAPDLPRIDVGSGVALVTMGTAVGATIGVLAIWVLAIAAGGDEALFAVFASFYAVLIGGVIGLVCALVNVGVLVAARLVGPRADAS